MASKVNNLLRASTAAPWLTFAAIMAVGIAASQIALASIALIDSAATAAARDGLWRITHGDPLLLASEIRALSLIAWVAVIQPLTILGLMLMIERLAGPSEREPKDYMLAVMVQSAFLLFVYALAYTTGKIGLQTSSPLIHIEPAIGLAGLIFQTLPLYLLALFLGDFLRYWFHRAQHRSAFLWRFHSVHHSPRDLDVLHNIVHPVEELGSLIVILLPAAFLIGVNAGQLYLLTAFLAVQAHIHHMNVPIHYGPLSHVFVDNRYHFLHHSRDPKHFNSNFAALFPVLDRLFGTYQAPEPGPLPATGLGDGAPTRFTHYLLGSWPERDKAGIAR